MFNRFHALIFVTTIVRFKFDAAGIIVIEFSEDKNEFVLKIGGGNYLFERKK